MLKARHLMRMLVTAVISASACAGQEHDTTPEQTAAPVTVYVNGRVYTQDGDLPWAQAFVTRGDRFVFVGSTEETLGYSGRVMDLQGRFVMPGIIDAHTHPGLVAIWGDLSVLGAGAGEIERPVETDRMPSRPKEATLAWLQRYADDHPSAPVIAQGT